jgi:23S rRNA pseudouridine1911/1915/1917 synthase
LFVKIKPEDPIDQVEPGQALPDDEMRHFVLEHGLGGQRLDKALAQLMPEYSRARIQGWIESSQVCVNNQTQTRVRHIVSAGDSVSVSVQPSEQLLAYEPDDVPFKVLAQAPAWLVVDKHAGLVVHPGAGNWRHTLLNGLLFHHPANASIPRAGIVHRLDKDTTGLMVVAKTVTAQTHLVRQLQQRTVKREYCALVHGWLTQDQLTIDRSIGRDPRVPVRMSVAATGASKPALTLVHAQRTGTLQGMPVTELRCQLQTGRTHQIRVHLSSIKHPLVGDVLYGGRELGGATRQMLHAQRLSFIDPDTQQWVDFESPIPLDMQDVLAQVQWRSEDN